MSSWYHVIGCAVFAVGLAYIIIKDDDDYQD